MSVLPVIHRELRVASRRRATWFIRLALPLGAAAALVLGLLTPDRLAPPQGDDLLGVLAVFTFPIALLAGPFLTADAIGSERRDGTLGLLLLTPLLGIQIVAGKLVTHAFQAGCSLVATFPFLFVPVLAGGVAWPVVMRLVLVLLVTLLLSLALSIAWSARVSDPRTSVLGSFVSLLLLTFVPWTGILLADAPGPLPSLGPRLATLPSPLSAVLLSLDTPFRQSWSAPGRPFAGAEAYAASVVLMATSALVALRVAGRAVSVLNLLPSHPGHSARSAGAGPPPRVGVSSPAGGSWNNPVAGFAFRALGPRRVLFPIEWAGVVAILILLAVTSRLDRLQAGFATASLLLWTVHLIVRLRWCMAATTWMQEMRQSGGLEILLTTPLPDSRLIHAHHASLRFHGRPSVLALVALNLALLAFVIARREDLHLHLDAVGIFGVFFLGGSLITLADAVCIRWLGLQESFRRGSRLRVFGRCFGYLVSLPWAGMVVLQILMSRGASEATGALGVATWVTASLVWDLALVWICQRWLALGFRQRAHRIDTPPSAVALK